MHAFLLFLTDRRTGHVKIFIGKISKVIFLEVAGRFASFLAEKLRMIKAVNCRRALSCVAWAMHTSGGRISGVLFWRAFDFISY